jgi:two-component system LytT family response regulator
MNAQTQPLTVAIADDEALGRERVRIFLESLEREGEAITIVAECAGGQDAVAQVTASKPDLLFLDVQMPDLDGFGVIDELARAGVMPMVIFVTAHDEHAVRAFELHALDFLPKPVSRERFAAAVRRARDMLAMRREGELTARLMAWVAAERPPVPGPTRATGAPWRERIEVKNPQRWDYVPVADVLWMRAGGNYIELAAGVKTHLVRETMQDMESSLDPARFLRIGRSTIVNLGAVRAIRPQAKGAPLAELEDGTTLPVQRNLEELQKRLQFARAR